MKSFICETDCGEMILTIRYFSEYKNFKLYLYGIQHNFQNNGINFYLDSATKPIKAVKEEILQAADRVVRTHHYWTIESQETFEKWFNNLWKQTSVEDSFYIFE